jgi:hypothetical protein
MSSKTIRERAKKFYEKQGKLAKPKRANALPENESYDVVVKTKVIAAENTIYLCQQIGTASAAGNDYDVCTTGSGIVVRGPDIPQMYVSLKELVGGAIQIGRQHKAKSGKRKIEPNWERVEKALPKVKGAPTPKQVAKGLKEYVKGREERAARAKGKQTSIKVGDGATKCVGSDCYPYTVVEVLSPTKLVLQATKQRQVKAMIPKGANMSGNFSGTRKPIALL